MKSFVAVLIVFFPFFLSNAQNCIDVVIIQMNDKQVISTDTLFCKIISSDETGILIDNGLSISTFSWNNIKDTIFCIREMNAYEVFKFKGLDNVTKDYFNNSFTAGSALRKAAFKTYLSTGLAIIGGSSVILGLTALEDTNAKLYCIIGGSLLTATSLYFVISAWNQIYKAGKMLDLNEKASLFLAPASDGNFGVIIKF